MHSKLNRQQRIRMFEQFEQRLVMSAQSIAGDAQTIDPQVLVDQILQQGEFTTQSFGADMDAQIDQIRQQYGFDGSGQTVAIIDSGIAWNHYALGGGWGEDYRVVGGWDFAENDANPYDDGPAGYHGTHVAGIVASDDAEYPGVAPGADLVGLRVFDDAGNTEMEWVEQALQWVHEHQDSFANPITTVNLSIGTEWNADTVPNWATLEDEFARLRDDGIFISVAAGNSYSQYDATGLSYPASSPFVVPVASHDIDGDMSEFSQRNERVLVAPGESIFSSVPGHMFGSSTQNHFVGISGTSMSAPLVAGASTLLRQANLLVGAESVDQDLLYEQFRQTADRIFDAETGSFYSRINLQAAIDSVVHSWNPDEPGGAANPLGTVESMTLDAQVLDQETFQLQAAHNGLLTAVARGQAADQPVRLIVFDSEMNLLQTKSVEQGNARIDIHATAGEDYFVRVETDGDVRLDLANLVSLEQGHLVVRGTSGADEITLDAGNRLRFNVNGLNYQFNPDGVQTVTVAGRHGNDQLDINLGQSHDRITLRQHGITIANSGLRLNGSGFETIDVNAGGGTNRAVFVDSIGNDEFVFQSGDGTMTGDGFENRVSSVSRIHASSESGFDTVRMYGSQQSERFAADQDGSYFSSGQIQVSATGFERSYLQGGGGQDVVNLSDSAGDDQFVIREGRAFVHADNYRVWVDQISRINAESRSGNDHLVMHDSIGNDRFYANSATARMVGASYSNYATGFAQVQATASAGDDLAQLRDSVQNDLFQSNTYTATLSNSTNVTSVQGFDRVNAVANHGGYDVALVAGSLGNDVVYADSHSTTVDRQNQSTTRTVGFDHVQLDGLGGHDVSTLRGHSGNDRLVVESTRIRYENAMRELHFENIENTHFDGNGGIDEVIFGNIEELDLLAGLGDGATAYLAERTISAIDFDLLEASLAAGEEGVYDIDAVDFLYMLRGNWRQS